MFITAGKIHDRYDASELLNFKLQVREVTVFWAATFLLLAGTSYAMKIGANFSRGSTLTFALLGFTRLIATRIVWRIVLADGLAIRRFSSRKIALITDEYATANSETIEVLSQHGMDPAHHFVLTNDAQSRKKAIASAIEAVRGSDISEVVLGVDLTSWLELKGLLAKLRVLPVSVKLFPVGPTSDLFQLPFHLIGDNVTIELQRGPRTLSERILNVRWTS